MKIIVRTAFLMGTITALATSSLSAQKLIILHTNDMHSHQNGLAPETEYTPLVTDNDPTLGGFARIAGFIKKEKESHENVLVLDAGDFLMGTLFQTMEPTHGAQLPLMKQMGYDVIALGNHEFDFGPNGLARIIQKSKTTNEIPAIVNSNYEIMGDTTDTEFAELIHKGIILPYVVMERAGKKIGIFSVLGTNAHESIPSYHPTKFRNIEKTAQEMVSILRNQLKADFVIVLSHTGIRQNKRGQWKGEDFELAKNVRGIDLIISGHTHTTLHNPIVVNQTTIVQAGSMGAQVGRVEVDFSNATAPTLTANLVEMNDQIEACPDIQKQVDQHAQTINSQLLKPLGYNFSNPVFETTFPLTIDESAPLESNLGPIVADAIHEYLNKRLPTPVDISFIATGVIRHNIENGHTGIQNINDVFNVVPLGEGYNNIPGTPLGKAYITGNEVKKLMELILAIYPMKPEYFLYYSGMEIDYNPKKRIFKKISAIRLGTETDGFRPISTHKRDTTLYCLASNKYMLGFIGNLKTMSKGIVKITPRHQNGSPITDGQFTIDLNSETEGISEAKEWVALLKYFSKFEDTNGDGIPDLPAHYENERIRLNATNRKSK
jgi:5'-nucleotidase / UDP-sugar diphosphatase